MSKHSEHGETQSIRLGWRDDRTAHITAALHYSLPQCCGSGNAPKWERAYVGTRLSGNAAKWELAAPLCCGYATPSSTDEMHLERRGGTL